MQYEKNQDCVFLSSSVFVFLPQHGLLTFLVPLGGGISNAIWPIISSVPDTSAPHFGIHSPKMKTQDSKQCPKVSTYTRSKFCPTKYFFLLNTFLRNQLIKAASVPDFSSTRVKNGMFEKILLQN